MSSRPTTKRKILRRTLIAFFIIVAVDQLLFWTLATRPAGSLRKLLSLTHAPEPPYYELERNLTTSYESWGQKNLSQIHTNSLGLRERERDPQRASGKKRVIVTGDSIAFGIGVNDEDAFPQQMERQLEARGDSHIEVWNAGVPGYAMADHLGFLRRRLLPLRPDLIVLQLSRNDNAIPMPLSETFMTSLRFSGLSRTWMIYRFNFVEDTTLFSKSMRGYLEECRNAAIKLLVVFEGLPEENRAEFFNVTHEYGIEPIEIGGDAYPKLPDDPHYNAEGNKRVAARLVPEVLSLLGEPRE